MTLLTRDCDIMSVTLTGLVGSAATLSRACARGTRSSPGYHVRGFQPQEPWVSLQPGACRRKRRENTISFSEPLAGIIDELLEPGRFRLGHGAARGTKERFLFARRPGHVRQSHNSSGVRHGTFFIVSIMAHDNYHCVRQAANRYKRAVRGIQHGSQGGIIFAN